MRRLRIVNAPSPAMRPPAIDSTGKPPTFGMDAVVLVEAFAELVVFETWAGAVPVAGPPTIEMTPFDGPVVKVKDRFAPLTET